MDVEKSCIIPCKCYVKKVTNRNKQRGKIRKSDLIFLFREMINILVYPYRLEAVLDLSVYPSRLYSCT